MEPTISNVVFVYLDPNDNKIIFIPFCTDAQVEYPILKDLLDKYLDMTDEADKVFQHSILQSAVLNSTLERSYDPSLFILPGRQEVILISFYIDN